MNKELGVIRRPVVFDIDYIANNARQADKDEVFNMNGLTISEAFKQTPNLYKDSYVWEVDGKVVCIYGVTDSEGDKVIWFLATDDFDKFRTIIGKRSKGIFERLIKGCKYVYNYVHYKHTKALKWAKWLGFKVYSPEPVGLNGELYCKIEVCNV